MTKPISKNEKKKWIRKSVYANGNIGNVSATLHSAMQ